MAKDRCPEPLDLPPGTLGSASRAAYRYMLEQLGITLGQTGRARLCDEREIGEQMRDKYPSVPTPIAAGIAYMAFRDMEEIQNL